jgi:hypothetical protein
LHNLSTLLKSQIVTLSLVFTRTPMVTHFLHTISFVIWTLQYKNLVNTGSKTQCLVFRWTNFEPYLITRMPLCIAQQKPWLSTNVTNNKISMAVERRRLPPWLFSLLEDDMDSLRPLGAFPFQ